MNIFKRSFALILAVFLILALTACGNSNSAGGTTSKDTSSNNKSSGNNNSGDGIQKLTIKISHVVAKDTPKNKGAEAMAQYIEQHSNGQIKVQVYPNSSLFGDKDEVENLIANNVQFIIPDMSKLVGKNPAFNIPSLPFLFKDNQGAYAFWDGPTGQKVLSSLKGQGIIGLRMWPNGPKQITNAKHPIKTPADLAGLKIRVQGGQVLASVYKTLGAGPLTLPFSQLYTALDQHTVDGEVNTYSNIYTKKLDDVQKYMTTNWGATRVDYALLTNTKFWDSLNAPTKKVIQAGIEYGTKTARSLAEKLNQEAADSLKKNGKIQIYQLTDAERQVFQDKLQPIYAKYQDQIGKDIIDAAKKAAANN